MATNIETTIEGNTLIIKVDLSKEHGTTKSGKSIKIASSDGNMSIPGREEITLGLNVYKPQPSSSLLEVNAVVEYFMNEDKVERV